MLSSTSDCRSGSGCTASDMIAASSTPRLSPPCPSLRISFRISNGMVTAAFLSSFGRQNSSFTFTAEYGVGRIG